MIDVASSRKRNWTLAGALLALGAGLAGGITLGFVDPPRQARRMPHGPTLELRGWTLAPGETFVDGSFWQRLALHLNQPYLQLGGYRGSQNSGKDLALWFRTSHDHPATGAFTGVWIDEHGCRLSTQETLASAWTLLPQRMPLSPRTPPAGLWVAPASEEVRWVATPDTRPRRGTGPLTYALVQEEEPEPLATFTVPRPREPASFPQWPVHAVPVSATNESTTFVLTGLRHRTGSRLFNESTATFHYLGPDVRSTAWEPALVTVSDATGNRLVTASWRSAAATFRSLCPRETAWKLKVRFARPLPPTVPPDEEWTWRDLPLSDRHLTAEGRPAFSRGDVTAHLDKLQRHPAKPWDRQPKAEIVVSVSCPEGYQLTLRRATDERGRSVGLPLVYAGDQSKDRTRDRNDSNGSRFYVPVRPETRRLNLTFALHRTRTVEFTVHP